MKLVKFLLILSFCLICQSQNDTITTEDSGSDDEVLPAHFLLIKVHNKTNSVIDNIKLIGLLLSVVFLIGTVVVYLSLPELKNNRGTVLMNYFIGCLIISFAALFCIKIKLINFSSFLCLTTDILCYFFFFASLFWSSVMSFDIWRTIKQLSPQSGGFKQERKKFLIYSLLVWGCALIFTCINVIMNKMDNPSTDPPYCWFNDNASMNIYLYGPQALITCCNTIFFVLTIYMTSKIRRNIADQMRGKDSQRHDENNHWFYLCFKLSIVMGVTWSFETLALILESVLPEDSWITEAAQLPSDIIVSSQGIIIFIIFVCMGKPRKILFNKIEEQRKGSIASETTMTETMTESITVVNNNPSASV